VPPPTAADAPNIVLLRGLDAGPGVASGVVRVLATQAEGAALLAGEVLVTAMTSPDWVPLMRRAAAVVTDAGGMTSHAAIISRELGIPCMVGARTTTTTLRPGMPVTVDAGAGAVGEGAVVQARDDAHGPTSQRNRPAEDTPAVGTPPVTATRIYVNPGETGQRARVAAPNERSALSSRCTRYGAFGRRTTGSTAHGRCGDSSGEMAPRSHGAPWSGQ
jgi:pyruvate,water dikinase